MKVWKFSMLTGMGFGGAVPVAVILSQQGEQGLSALLVGAVLLGLIICAGVAERDQLP